MVKMYCQMCKSSLVLSLRSDPAGEAYDASPDPCVRPVVRLRRARRYVPSHFIFRSAAPARMLMYIDYFN
jgi:hypothetical protein